MSKASAIAAFKGRGRGGDGGRIHVYLRGAEPDALGAYTSLCGRAQGIGTVALAAKVDCRQCQRELAKMKGDR